MQRIRCQPSNFTRLPWHLGPILALLGLIFEPWSVSKQKLAAPKFAENPTSKAGSRTKAVKAACHAKSWGSAAIYTNCLFNFSRLPWHLGPDLGPSWAHFSPLWLSKHRLTAPKFAENPVPVAGSKERMEFAENPGPEGRKTKNQGAPNVQKMWNSSRTHPAS